MAHAALHLDRAQHGFDDAGEFNQHAVAGIFDDTPVVLLDLGVHKLAAMRLEALVRSLLIRAHQARIPDRIGGQDRGKTAGRGHSSRDLWPKLLVTDYS